jgi:hypothetical protein
MKRKVKKKTSPGEVWAWVQLREWTKTVDRKLALILEALKGPIGNDDVIPELEEQVNRAATLARGIDLKVEDEATNKKKG